MSEEILIRGFFLSGISIVTAKAVSSRYDTEMGIGSSGDDRQRYLPYFPGNLLMFWIPALAVSVLIGYDIQAAAKMTLSMCFGIFLHISLYYLILIMTVPFFRRYISARACAALWLIPNALYIMQNSFMKLQKPLWVIRAPQKSVWVIFYVWLAGFLMVLMRTIISHLVFRSWILKTAKEITDTEILELWNNEIDQAKMQSSKYRLVISQNVKTPLSIGLFRRTTCVVLPDKEYSTEELRLIFRHEIVHIGREDVWSKFFLSFCTAMCWFNPLMWIAMRKCADDLELSCDETVLLGSDAEVRHRYANLLLNTAGDERGFTTCLSASASALRYRLKNIMKPKKRHSGALTVGVMLFILCMSCGYVALAYGNSSGQEIIYQNRDPNLYKIGQMYFTMKDSDYNRVYECVDVNAFHAYMSDLVMDNLTGNYFFSDNDRELHFYYDTPEGTIYVTLSDHMIHLIPDYEEDAMAYYYYLPEGVDWEYLDEIIVGYPALNVQFVGENNFEKKEISASIRTVRKYEAGTSFVLYENELLKEDINGIYGASSYDKAVLKFSHELASAYTVESESWDGKIQDTILQKKSEKPFEIPVLDCPAHYTIFADFYGQMTQSMKWNFDLT